jgi:hypothetical protein
MAKGGRKAGKAVKKGKSVSAGGRAQRSLEEAIRENTKLAIFVASLVLTDGNITEASKSAGIGKSTGYTYCRRYPEIQEKLREARATVVSEALQDWKDMANEARGRIRELMRSVDERVATANAQYVVDRVEGRPKQGIDVDMPDAREETASALVAFAMAYALEQGATLEAALTYARENEEEVQTWLEEYGPATEA